MIRELVNSRGETRELEPSKLPIPALCYTIAVSQSTSVFVHLHMGGGGVGVLEAYDYMLGVRYGQSSFDLAI